LEKYLEEILPPLDEPMLNKIWKFYQNTMSNNTNSLQEQYAKLKEKYEEMVKENKEASNKLKEEKEVWTQVRKGILDMNKKLSTAIKTKTASESFIKNCKEQIRNYQNLLTKGRDGLKNIKDESMSNSVLIERKEEIKKCNEVDKIQDTLSLPELNYNRLKAFLLTSEDDAKVCAVLQALILEIGKHKKSSNRIRIIQHYIDNDILDCKMQGQVIERLLEHTSKK